jgi:hypothetical protein
MSRISLIENEIDRSLLLIMHYTQEMEERKWKHVSTGGQSVLCSQVHIKMSTLALLAFPWHTGDRNSPLALCKVSRVEILVSRLEASKRSSLEL